MRLAGGGRTTRRVSIVASVLLAACSNAPSGSTSSASVAEEDEPWIRRVPAATNPGTRLPERAVCVVVDGLQERAQQRLLVDSWTPISPDDVRDYTGGALDGARASGIPVLLRGVQPVHEDETTLQDDEFRVTCDGTTVVVTCLAYRTRMLPVQRRALVAFVPIEPSQVYVRPLTAIVGGLGASK